jgi:hypothetical protein
MYRKEGEMKEKKTETEMNENDREMKWKENKDIDKWELKRYEMKRKLADEPKIGQKTNKNTSRKWKTKFTHDLNCYLSCPFIQYSLVNKG